MSVLVEGRDHPPSGPGVPNHPAYREKIMLSGNASVEVCGVTIELTPPRGENSLHSLQVKVDPPPYPDPPRTRNLLVLEYKVPGKPSSRLQISSTTPFHVNVDHATPHGVQQTDLIHGYDPRWARNPPESFERLLKVQVCPQGGHSRYTPAKVQITWLPADNDELLPPPPTNPHWPPPPHPSASSSSASCSSHLYEAVD